MARLSREQLQFLEQQEIPLSRVFDASGMSKLLYGRAMSELEMIVAHGVSPCREAGHTLRTRAGHCAQCDTARLAFLRRYDEQGEVYVAYSSQIGLTKIGVAKGYQERLRNLNSQGYGGATDWSIDFHCECNKAGRVEFLAQQKLKQYRVTKSYFKTGQTVHCQELFNCKMALARSAVKNAVKEAG